MHRRREIADRVIARWTQRGFALEADPNYIGLVELWIAGEIGGTEMRRRYAEVLRNQIDERTKPAVGAFPQPSPVELDVDGFHGSDGGSRQAHVEPQAGSEPNLETD